VYCARMALTKCNICQKEFYIKPSHLKRGWGKYCSIKCRATAQFRGKDVKCFICLKTVYRSPKSLTKAKSGKYFCSKSCQTLWRNGIYVGNNSPNWKNGEHAYRKILKRSSKSLACTLCGITDERILTAHHMDHNRNNNDLDNLTWLCLNCHHLVHHNKVLKQQLMDKASKK